MPLDKIFFNYPKALDYYHKDLQISKETGDKKGSGKIVWGQCSFGKDGEYGRQIFTKFKRM
jgi:hypothetical protein